jgi:UDP-2,3-diacylglucosamine pyrophosphatase LpxH
MRVVILSDCHVGSPEANIGALNKFLSCVQCDKLVLAGDFFDLWDMSAGDIRDRHAKTIGLVKKIIERGVLVEYLLGNHDDDYLDHPVMGPELPVVKAVEFYTHSGKKVRVVHGDKYDHVYQRHRLLYKMLAWANKVSKKVLGLSFEDLSHKTCTSLPRGEYDEAVRKIHEAARKKSKGFDILVMGHTHSPIHSKAAGELPEFLNAGDWKVNDTYVLVDGDSVSLEHYCPKEAT